MKKFIVFLSVFVFFSGSLLSGQTDEIVLDDTFFKEFGSRQAILRDDIVENMLNKIVIGRGVIKDVSASQRYKKRYRIIIESSDSAPYSQKFLFFVFLENKDTIDLLNVNTKFEFKGQLTGYTPLNTKRNEYILDVILKDGSTVIE